MTDTRRKWPSTAAQGAAEETRPRPGTMSDSGEIRYCQRFSYVFLKFILFAYAIGWWVSKVAAVAR